MHRYMLPAAVRDTGTTVVFQPLLSLITDQVAKARGHGIKTAVFTDEMSEDQVDTVRGQLFLCPTNHPQIDESN